MRQRPERRLPAGRALPHAHAQNWSTLAREESKRDLAQHAPHDSLNVTRSQITSQRKRARTSRLMHTLLTGTATIKDHLLTQRRVDVARSYRKSVGCCALLRQVPTSPQTWHSADMLPSSELLARKDTVPDAPSEIKSPPCGAAGMTSAISARELHMAWHGPYPSESLVDPWARFGRPALLPFHMANSTMRLKPPDHRGHWPRPSNPMLPATSTKFGVGSTRRLWGVQFWADADTIWTGFDKCGAGRLTSGRRCSNVARPRQMLGGSDMPLNCGMEHRCCRHSATRRS